MSKVRVLASIAVLALAGCGDRGGAPVADPTPLDDPLPAVEPGRAAGAGETLRRVRARGRLDCGVHTGLPGFAFTDNRGRWRGFDVDFCRATAAVALGDPDAVRYVPLGPTERFEALRRGRVDVLWRNTSFTFTRDVAEGFDFPGVNYYDGQGFLVRRALNLTSATELNGARICVQAGSTTELNAADFFRLRGLRYEAVLAQNEEQARAAYAREACDAYTADISALAGARLTMNNPAAHVILPDVISKEPLGPVVRHGDDAWADLVRWTLHALILAEELGVTAENAEELRRLSPDPRVRRLLGVEGGFGEMLGVRNDWAYRAIRSVGNYGQVFERNLGQGSSLRLERGLNALHTASPPGLMYAPPIR